MPVTVATAAYAQDYPEYGVSVETVAENLSIPWSIDWTPDGMILFTERDGNLRVIQDGKLQESPLLSLGVVGVEGGLLGVAVDPNYTETNHIYLYYTYDELLSTKNKLVRYQLTDGVLTEDKVLLEGIPGGPFHDGGRIQFGPDGKLYITTGDAGNPNLSQDISSLGGKILRINSDGTVPEDNPLEDSPIYSIGHRNPQGLDWDENDNLVATEHGPSGERGRGHDEVNVIIAGTNYGWPDTIGDETGEDLQNPILHTGDDTWAPSGAEFYYGDKIPQWTGKYFVATLRGNHLHMIDFDLQNNKIISNERLFQDEFGRLRDVATGPDGFLYILTSNQDGRGSPEYNDDRILRIAPLDAYDDKEIISSFEDCISAGNPVMESHPRQCSTEDGRNFVEQIPNIPADGLRNDTASLSSFHLPPLKQIKDNRITSENVTCDEGLELVLKLSNGKPACIKASSVEKLIERGWAMRILPDSSEQTPSRDMITLKGEVWADNWFALYLDQDLIIEDSISINTERSFNSEVFTFDAAYPIHLNFIVKDFKENDTGLEYIGTSRQQMGDGGFIAQFTNTHTGEISAVTDQNVQCTAVHQAPLNPTCAAESNPIAGEGNCNFISEEEPAEWKSPHFDDDSWRDAIVYSENQVQPKDGYDKINWNSNAKLIWTEDLEVDNTILCRITIDDDSNIVESQQPLPPRNEEGKGYAVTEIARGVYWLSGSGYQTMFLTTGEGVVAVDAPKPIGEKYLDAINEVTDEPTTHMIYSHHHQDHTGAAGEIFPEDITYIAHKDAADLLVSENDPARPIPNMTLEGDFNTLEIGDKTIEFHNIGDFHSKGNLLILLPQHKIGMLVDLFRPAESPYKAFGNTPDIELYLKTHDVLKTFDFDVLITGHTNLLATKDHITTNKEFTQSIMDNAQDALDSGNSSPADACAANSITQWEGKLGNLDAFMVDHCNAMIKYIQSK